MWCAHTPQSHVCVLIIMFFCVALHLEWMCVHLMHTHTTAHNVMNKLQHFIFVSAPCRRGHDDGFFHLSISLLIYFGVARFHLLYAFIWLTALLALYYQADRVCGLLRPEPRRSRLSSVNTFGLCSMGVCSWCLEWKRHVEKLTVI